MAIDKSSTDILTQIKKERTNAEPMQGKALGVEVPSGYVLRKEPRDTKVLILIPKRVKDKLQAKADLQRRSTNDLINEILEREVNKIED